MLFELSCMGLLFIDLNDISVLLLLSRVISLLLVWLLIELIVVVMDCLFISVCSWVI